MSTFESFGQEGMETPSETGLGAIELVNYTEVGKFGSSLPFMLNQQTRCQDNILLTQKFRKFLKP
jgi:hypothetical protein